MNVDTSKWSGEGTFTQLLVDHLGQVPTVAGVRVEDAPATRSEADYNFISNELFIDFVSETREERTRKWGFVPVRHVIEIKAMTIAQLEAVLASDAAIGPPDYADAGMLQYLRTERIIPPYQTRGYKIVELVRIYEGERAAS
jgi:hypothetical protein